MQWRPIAPRRCRQFNIYNPAESTVDKTAASALRSIMSIFPALLVTPSCGTPRGCARSRVYNTCMWLSCLIFPRECMYILDTSKIASIPATSPSTLTAVLY